MAENTVKVRVAMIRGARNGEAHAGVVDLCGDDFWASVRSEVEKFGAVSVDFVMVERRFNLPTEPEVAASVEPTGDTL
jgi:hypothetical protein